MSKIMPQSSKKHIIEPPFLEINSKIVDIKEERIKQENMSFNGKNDTFNAFILESE